MSCPQIWKIEKEKGREKEKVRRQASDAQRQKEPGDIFCWRKNMKFCSGDEIMRNVKKVNKNTYISSIKRVTRKLLEVSRCSRVKQGQRNVQRKWAARAKLLFC